MTFLMDADLPRSAADVVRRHGYDAVDVRDIGLRHAYDSEIASHAQ
jgi:predicted nuclease of predicted toxin-antitoxin system